MTTPNLGLDTSLVDLVEGQEQKEAVINANFDKLNANMILIDGLAKYHGKLASAPTDDLTLGSTYFNTTDNLLYFLKCDTPSDTWIVVGGASYLGSLASDPASGNGVGSRYYNTTVSKFRTLTSIGPDVWTDES